MAILRLNDGKHFVLSATEVLRKDRVYGSISTEKKLVLNQFDNKAIKKAFEPLYANHLQFMGKVVEA
jgi:hypothetical protein